MRRLLLRWLGAADADHVVRLQLRVQEQGAVLSALALARVMPDPETQAHAVAVCRAYMADARFDQRLPQVRVRAPEEGARAALLAYLVALGLVVAAVCYLSGCTIRGSRDEELAPPPPDLAAPDLRRVRPAPPVCGTLLPGRMP